MLSPLAGHTPTIIIWVISLLSVATIKFQTEVLASPQESANQKDGANSKQTVDDILKDTMLLLDALDQKVVNIQNKTPNALMRDNLRALDSSEGHQDYGRTINLNLLQSVGDGFLANEMAASSSANEQSDSESSISLSSSLKPNIGSASSHNKQARQLMDENQLASDSTERHIKFTLDLMRAVFASHSSSPSGAQSQVSASSGPKTTTATTTTNSIDSFLISPLSIQMVLMMMHLGARGQTRRELGNCLHLAPEKLSVPAQQHQVNLSSLESSSGKLKRKNQATENGIKPQRQAQAQRQQASVGAGNGGSAAHEMFGSAVRNLLKDQSVLRALTSANQLFLQKNLPLAHQFESAIRQHYAADIKLVDFQHQSTSANSNSSLYSTSSSSSTSTGDKLNPNNNSSSSSNNISGADGKQVDHSVQQIINDWIERQSRGKISNFLTSPVPASTLLMAINVIYFKGDWQYKFDSADTEQDAWFTQSNGRQVKIPMMVNRLPLAFAHDAAMRTSVIELPYRAQRLGLFLLLPDDISGIFHTMQMLNSTSFAHLISSMRKPSHNLSKMSSSTGSVAAAAAAAADPLSAGNGINIRIPKFSIESSPRLSQLLSQQLGLKSLFAPDTADLTGMFPVAYQGKRTPISSNRSVDEQQPSVAQVGLDELIHKAVLQVDEQGSVAAATSATIVERVGTFSGNYFEADHPFLIFLMDKQTGLVLFSGVFAGPNQPDGSPSCKRNNNNSQQLCL